jgi:hypothetical protein
MVGIFSRHRVERGDFNQPLDEPVGVERLSVEP